MNKNWPDTVMVMLPNWCRGHSEVRLLMGSVLYISGYLSSSMFVKYGRKSQEIAISENQKQGLKNDV